MKKGVLSTLAYADIFDYPLTKQETWEWIIADNLKFKESLANLIDDGLIEQEKGYYFLRGRQKIVEIRRKREKWSAYRFKRAEKIAKFLRLIPWIKLIGVTGALARNNATKDDDIDFFIVTSPRRLWLTRLLVVCALNIFSLYRRPGKVSNMICPNIFIDKDSLKMEPEDLFIAHEVCLLRTVFEREDTYQKFLQTNLWVERFLPNRFKALKKLNNKIIGDKKMKNNFLCCLINELLNFFEFLAWRSQFRYMAKRITKETVSEKLAKFHPNDVRCTVLDEYSKKVENLLK